MTSEEAPVWFKHKAWIPIAGILSLVNLASVWFAARPGETWHATAHALGAVLFALGAQYLAVRHRALSMAESELGGNGVRDLAEAIDAIAVELERVGEGQRFVTKPFAERGVELSRPTPARQPEAEPARRDPPPRET